MINHFRKAFYVFIYIEKWQVIRYDIEIVLLIVEIEFARIPYIFVFSSMRLRRIRFESEVTNFYQFTAYILIIQVHGISSCFWFSLQIRVYRLRHSLLFMRNLWVVMQFEAFGQWKFQKTLLDAFCRFWRK